MSCSIDPLARGRAKSVASVLAAWSATNVKKFFIHSFAHHVSTPSDSEEVTLSECIPPGNKS